ncbi:unnamed protein product [Brassica rapa]|uniref:Leucine-rich repeat-containing N-terminal plant-type domain-containing protein n=1 Tax=Brassica campestris TaxID=3711 RepID=A0A3P6B9E3_BRACM|nr:unnamed protein product [Brassica rapa]VDD01743.1 unnamed protein product [Brassica rapa]
MNSSCLFTTFIFAAVISLGCLRSTGAATCHPDDEAGLLSFKAGITEDPLGILSSWKKGTDCCSWFGVICITGDRVTELRILGSSVLGVGFLSGTISPSLAKLEHLETLSFTNLLNITGPFPQFLFRLPKLRYVTIRDNRLSGPLPVNIGSLSELVELDLEGNRLTGPIPSSISNLTRLTWLNLGGNSLSGTIPDVFKSMKELGLIDLSRNGLYGKLPPSMESLAHTLTSLYLSQNNLSGTIPDYFSEFKALATFDLSRNRFTGVVPMSFAKLKSLFHLKLSHNFLTGPLPALNPVNGIASLDLSYNRFHLKTIPQWVTSSPSMYDLRLVKCGIEMNIEEWEPVRTGLFYIVDLSKNDISGSPARFLNRADVLQEFRASGNKLRFDLGKLNFTKSLRILDLSRNLVYGKVPASVAGLRKLSLSQNNLCGRLAVTKFPASVFTGNDCLCGSPLPPCKT